MLKLYIDRNNEKEYSKYINNEHELAIDERKVHMEENMIITISRQYGSGGSQVAKILAERMGVWCYDRDILTIVPSQHHDSRMDAPFLYPDIQVRL